MNMLLRVVGSLSLLLGVSVAAQDEASTLARLVDASSAVVEARVVALPDPGGDPHRVVFRVQRRIAGDVDDTFELSEPAMYGCGSALRGLVPGVGVLAFVRVTPSGVALTVPNVRAIPTKDPALVAHVTALVRTRDAAGRLRLATAALGDAHERIRRDASIDLSWLPGVENADAAMRDALTAAVERHAQRRDPVLATTVRAAARAGADRALDTLLPLALDVTPHPLRRFAESSLTQFDAGVVVARLAASLPETLEGRARAVAICAQLPLAQARPLLLHLYSDPSSQLGALAGATLLRLGLPETQLPSATDDRRIDAVRDAMPAAPRFRSIRPGAAR